MNFKTFLACVIILFIITIASAAYATFPHSSFRLADGKTIDLMGTFGIGNGSIKDIWCTSNCSGFSNISGNGTDLYLSGNMTAKSIGGVIYADQYTTIQDAINASTFGSTIIVRGNYTISSILKIPSHLTIDFTGSVLTQAGGTNLYWIQNSNDTIGNTEIKLIGGTFDGKSNEQTAGGILRFTNVSNTTIEYGTYQNAWEGSIDIISSNNITIRDLTGFNAGTTLDMGSFIALKDSSNIRINNINVQNTGYAGIYIYATNGIHQNYQLSNIIVTGGETALGIETFTSATGQIRNVEVNNFIAYNQSTSGAAIGIQNNVSYVQITNANIYNSNNDCVRIAGSAILGSVQNVILNSLILNGCGISSSEGIDIVTYANNIHINNPSITKTKGTAFRATGENTRDIYVNGGFFDGLNSNPTTNQLIFENVETGKIDGVTIKNSTYDGIEIIGTSKNVTASLNTLLNITHIPIVIDIPTNRNYAFQNFPINPFNFGNLAITPSPFGAGDTYFNSTKSSQCVYTTSWVFIGNSTGIC